MLRLQTKTLMLLQRLFTPPAHGDKWTEFTTREWELRDSTAPLTLWSTVREAIQPIAADESISFWQREALLNYLEVFAHAVRIGSDKDWEDITSDLEAILYVVGDGEKADIVIVRHTATAHVQLNTGSF